MAAMEHLGGLLIALFVVATAVALLVRWLRIPYTVGLVLAGLALGATSLLAPPPLTQELMFTVFLPGLVFEAAFHLEFQRFWRNKVAILALALPGVVAAIALTVALLTPIADTLWFASGFTLVHGLVFAALIAATDPIAVVALFRRLGVPGRLGVLVEGESLLNDGTAIVLFAIVLDYARGGPFHPLVAVLQFVRVVGIGVLAGAAVGFIASQVIRQVDDAMIEITVTTLAAYGSFAAGDALHGSGVIATVAAGMLCGNYGARTGMSPSTRVAAETFWEYIAFALNSVVFLLIGFEVRLPVLLAAWRAILAAFVAVTIGRALLILAVTGLLRRTRERLPLGWSAVLTWGGLRGGLSMVLALALPQGFPHRDLLVAMTFGVVLISILLQGLTMAPLIRRLGIASSQRGQLEYEQHRAAALAARAALDALPPIAAEQAAPADLVGRLRSEYEASVQTAEHALEALHLADDDLRGETERVMRRTLLLVERDALLAARRRGVVAGEAYDKAAADVDVRLSRLESAGDD
jgi:CPA1 family monovalent cation:H+ antiporter